MDNKKTPSGTRYVLSLGIGGFVAYTVCYAGRSILSAIMPEMLQSTSFTREDFGLMGSAFFISYGFGQIVNGLLGDRVRARYMVSAGLFFEIGRASCRERV